MSCKETHDQDKMTSFTRSRQQTDPNGKAKEKKDKLTKMKIEYTPNFNNVYIIQKRKMKKAK